jgi:mono/diheme cytochrome c family protein
LQEATVTNGTPTVQYVFALTNISTEPITITSVHTSCGCTVAQLPTLPWTLAPGTNGQIKVVMNLAGKGGTVFKTVTVTSDKGIKNLLVKVVIQAVETGPMSSTREENQRIAKADRQAVFKGECAKCHAAPAQNRMGKDLFVAVCGICHEAEHRATLVADLRALKKETSADYWRTWINLGKEGTMMPAFAQIRGGPLAPEQVESLVDYLVEAFPSRTDTAPN